MTRIAQITAKLTITGESIEKAKAALVAGSPIEEAIKLLVVTISR